MEKITLKLETPIQAHGETISELAFRAPNGSDLMRCGSPFIHENTTAGETLTRTDNLATGKLISALAGIPTSSVGQMSALDFTAAQAAIIGFFAPKPEMPSTAA